MLKLDGQISSLKQPDHSKTYKQKILFLKREIKMHFPSSNLRTLFRVIFFVSFYVVLFSFAANVGRYGEAVTMGTPARAKQLYSGMVISVIVLSLITGFSLYSFQNAKVAEKKD